MRKIVFTHENDLGLYYLLGRRVSYADVAMSTQTIRNSIEKNKPAKLQALDINSAHDIYGHIGEAALHSTLKAVGIDATGSLNTCEGCSLGKAKAKPVSIYLQ